MDRAANRHRTSLRGGCAGVKLLLVNPNTSSTTTAAMLAIARDAAPAGVTVEAVTAKFGAALIVNPAALAVAATAVCAVVREPLDHAFHGVIVSAFGDPGLVLLRAALHLPVTGIAEASMREAARHNRFSIVTTTPELVGSIEATALAYGHAKALASVRITEGDPVTLTANPEALEEALYQACLLAVNSDRADAIIIGGGPLASAARRLGSRIAVPLIEPIPAAIRLAVERMHGVTGTAQ